MRNASIPALLAVSFGAGAALAPAPAAARSYERDRTEVFGRGERGWFEGSLFG